MESSEESAHPVAPPPKIKQPPVLFSKTQALLARIAERLEAPVLAYWNSPRGAICHSWSGLVTTKPSICLSNPMAGMVNQPCG